MKDGLETAEMTVNALSGNTLAIGAAIASAEIENDTITQAKFSAPDSFQQGTGTLSAGQLWVVFPTAFTNVPFGVATTLGTSDGTVTIQTNDAVGSMLVSGLGTETFNWIAIGSR